MKEKFSISLIKVKSFPYINVMPYLGTNMLSKVFYGSIGSEILRIAKTKTHLFNMVARVNLLLTRTKKQGSESTYIILLLKKIIENTLKYLISL